MASGGASEDGPNVIDYAQRAREVNVVCRYSREGHLGACVRRRHRATRGRIDRLRSENLNYHVDTSDELLLLLEVVLSNDLRL